MSWRWAGWGVTSWRCRVPTPALPTRTTSATSWWVSNSPSTEGQIHKLFHHHIIIIIIMNYSHIQSACFECIAWSKSGFLSLFAGLLCHQADSACERVFTVNDVSHGGCKYGIMNFSGCSKGSLSVEMCDNLYFTNRKVRRRRRRRRSGL